MIASSLVLASFMGTFPAAAAGGAQQPMSSECCDSQQQPAPLPGGSQGTIVLEAGKITFSGELVDGTGPVFAAFQGSWLEAESFTWNLREGRLLLGPGTWHMPTGNLSFSGANLLPGRSAGALEDPGYLGESGSPSVSAQRLYLQSGGEWKLHGLEATACSCPGECQPWSIAARRAWVRPGQGLRFTGGLLRVAGLPVLPLPVGYMALASRKSGLLLPLLEWTPDGYQFGVPFYLVMGPSADATLTPTYRGTRGPRLLSEFRYALAEGEGGELDAEGGYDMSQERWRGAMSWQHGWAPGRLRSAADLVLVSDADYPDDIWDDYLARQLPFHEARLLLGSGPFRLEHDSFQDNYDAPQSLLLATFSRPARGVGRLAFRDQLDMGLAGVGKSSTALDESWVFGRAGVGSSAILPLGPARLEADLGASGLLLRGLGLQDPQLAARASADSSLRITIPMWADHGAWRHLLQPSLAAGGSLWGNMGQLPDLAPELPEVPTWWLGPRLESRWLEQAAIPLHGWAEVLLSPDGLLPSISAWYQKNAWSASLLGEARWDLSGAYQVPMAAVELRHDDAVLDAWLRLIHAQQAISQDQFTAGLAWTLPLLADRWTPSWRVRMDARDGTLLEHALGLSFESRCHCLLVGIDATWAEDRETPGISFRLDAGSFNR